ncbi:hypothetical protein CAEBREN_06080 [Caenorhabditis brenneri]|uniref:Uncharacterized protein n=1 Tax=Caenorhabditis brenneri TaxID=135651 RepID=G0MS99_CAEBE|nr:hypothetical protein CAEBREN_06080 [Caenorhabditis brenneri]
MTTKYLTLPSIFQPNPDLEMMKYGIIYFVSSLLVLPLFLVLLKIMGCILNAFWIGDFPVMTLLAVCRILIFSSVIQLKKVPNSIKLMLIAFVSWTTFLIAFGSITQNFYLSMPSWDYDFETFGIELFEMQEILISFPCLVISYFAYIFMAYLIYAKKNLSSSVQSRKNEIIILFQSTFVTTYITFLIIVYHQAMFHIDLVDLTVTRNQAIMNMGLIFHCYVNPTLTIVCNKSLREECFIVLGFRKRRENKKSISITVSKASSIHPRKSIAI